LIRIDKGSFNKRNRKNRLIFKIRNKNIEKQQDRRKKQKERRKEKSISLSRTWYVEVSAFIIVNSSLTLLKVQNDKKIPFWR